MESSTAFTRQSIPDKVAQQFLPTLRFHGHLDQGLGTPRDSPESTPMTNSFRFLTSRQTPCFSRNQPKSPTRNPFRIHTYEISPCNSRRIRIYEKDRRGRRFPEKPKALAAFCGEGPRLQPVSTIRRLGYWVTVWFSHV